eukprot:GHRR01018466.1.p1 GENE.GHRR01018466.1~~GHRR01018466.1.p1  ORF type:complete len:823 (+),score=365.91 GHRR01018466.1:199-2667(+)
MSAQPRLPALPPQRRRKQKGQDPPLQLLQQQLVDHPLIKQWADQPSKVMDVLRSDPVLQSAAASNPELAHLLHPAMLQHALQFLMQPQTQQGVQSAPFPADKQALMQLQNYAVQLQYARAIGLDVQQQPNVGHCQASSAAAALSNPASAQPAAAASKKDMWAALQHRLQKFQERSQLLKPSLLPVASAYSSQDQPQQPYAALHTTLASMEAQQQLQQQPVQQPVQQHQAGVATASSQHQQYQQHQYAQQEQHAAAAYSTASAAVHSNTSGSLDAAAAGAKGARVSDSSSTMAELLVAFPGIFAPGDSSSGTFATIGLLSAVDPQATASLWPGSAGKQSFIGSQQQQGLKSTDGLLPSSSSQPQDQQQQRHYSSPDTVSSSSSSSNHPGSTTPSSRPPSGFASRPPSALGHKILRPHHSSPIPLGSGSQPLGIEHLGSGEVIVEITPPTRVTRELSWTLDPDAEYVLEASASGSFSPPLAKGALTEAAAAAAMFGVGYNTRGTEVAVGEGLRSPGTTGFETPAAADTAVAATAAGAAADVPSSIPAASAQLARCSSVGSSTAGGSSSKASKTTSRAKATFAFSASKQQKFQQQRQQLLLQQHSVPAPAISTSMAVAVPVAGVYMATGLPIQQQLQQQARAALAGSQAATFAACTDSSKGCDALGQQAPSTNANSAILGTYGDAYASAAEPAAAPAGKALNPKYYYEDVAPSHWRPSDGEEYAGDYLELYRRAYCSYADAIFPPMWLALMVLLTTSSMLPLWQLLLLGPGSFWLGLYLMAVKWAGVPSSRLSLSRVAPMTVVSLELLCTGVCSKLTLSNSLVIQ